MTGDNIVNMIKCVKGEHCLYRTFGLGSVTDDVNRLTRSAVQVEINRWFPGNTVTSISTISTSNDGEFIYNVQVRGV